MDSEINEMIEFYQQCYKDNKKYLENTSKTNIYKGIVIGLRLMKYISENKKSKSELELGLKKVLRLVENGVIKINSPEQLKEYAFIFKDFGI